VKLERHTELVKLSAPELLVAFIIKVLLDSVTDQCRQIVKTSLRWDHATNIITPFLVVGCHCWPGFAIHVDSWQPNHRRLVFI